MYYNCSELKEFNTGNSNPFIDVGNSTDKVTVTIGKDVLKIPSQLFAKCQKIKEIIFEDDCIITTIGISAFDNCTGLTSISLPSSITSLSSSIFSNCSNLTDIYINCTITESGNYNSSLFGNFFSKDITITIGKDVLSIPDYCFYNNTKIKSVIFESIPSIQSIGEYAFYGCSQLGSIIIPNSVTTIKPEVFENCTKLNTITFEDQNSKWNIYYYENLTISVNNPETNATYFKETYKYQTWTKQ